VYAIIEDRGTQIKVAEGDVFDIDLMSGEEKQPTKLTFDRVLLVGKGEGNATVGKPYISGASVTADVLDTVRGEKIDVIVYKRRKGQRRKIGHRQSYLRVKITGIKA
jgi:large subunit ribosomal protein L21